jgi:hypothetical protein
MLDPVAEFLNFKRNPRWYAEYWLRTGTRHPDEHFTITTKLDSWIERVTAAGREVVDKLRSLVLAELPPGGTA